MATVTKHINATPAAVYEVLSDGWEYSQWVVGTSHVRAVDAAWPQPGSKLHHAVGAWPLVLRDHTEMQQAEPNKRMLMTARGWPVGEAQVEILLEPEGKGTKFTIREDPTGGAGWLLRNPLGDALIYRRNVETAARLAALAERRTAPAAD
ncbi:MAG: hypothetical protein JWN96_2284 [Mycobacterium sp.]|jgi:uncharacterized protein YndB with AHSA1/START domain|nr:hypothetical protein [Mycobacterium sp.]